MELDRLVEQRGTKAVWWIASWLMTRGGSVVVEVGLILLRNIDEYISIQY